MKDFAFLLFSLILFQIISFLFLHLQVHFLVYQTFFLISLILFWNISSNASCIFLVLERFIFRPCFNRNLPIRLYPFLNWFRLFSFFPSLSCNKLISLLIFSISLFWLIFNIFILCIETSFLYTKWVKIFL